MGLPYDSHSHWDYPMHISTARTTMGVTLKKCHMIMSGNNCWNTVCFSCCRKADNELADMTLSCGLFQKCAAANGNARSPIRWLIVWTADVDQTRRRHGFVVSLHAQFCMSEQPFYTVSVLESATSASVMWSRALRWYTNLVFIPTATMVALYFLAHPVQCLSQRSITHCEFCIYFFYRFLEIRVDDK